MAKGSETKRKIGMHAQRLFDEKGYDSVSLREIADAAGTTIGNLTYHYPQKESLILEIQHDLHTGFAADFYIAEEGEVVLKNLLQAFSDIQTNEEENLFYFRNLAQLCKDSKTIAQTNERFRKKLYHYFFDCLERLAEQGFLRADLLPSHHASLASVMVVMATVWIQAASPYYDADTPRIPISTALKDVLYPCLTNKGVQVYSAC